MYQEISDSLTIEQDNAHYTLHLNSIGENISFNLDYNSNNYTKKLPLKEIKDKNSYAIFATMSINDFITALKKLSENKKISLIEKDNNIIIKIEIDIAFINHIIEIELMMGYKIQKKQKLYGIQNSEKTETIEIIQKELYELKMNYYALKNENIELKKTNGIIRNKK